MLDAFFQGFGLLLRWDISLYIAAGLTVGIFVGAMPGLTTILAMAVLLPISFKLEPMLGSPSWSAFTRAAFTAAVFPPFWSAFPAPAPPLPPPSTAPL